MGSKEIEESLIRFGVELHALEWKAKALQGKAGKEADMKDRPHVYNLPGEVAAAISTNRPEIMTMLINKVRQGHVIEKDHVVGILEAFRDIVKMRFEDNQRAQALGRFSRQLSDASKGIDKVEEKIREITRKLGSGEPLTPDELE